MSATLSPPPAPGRAAERLSRPSRALIRYLVGRAARADEAFPTSAAVRPEAESFRGGRGPVGVLLCHGFTGSPHSLRPWAEHLVGEGFRVDLPRLPGHGTTWQELNRTEWTDWYATVEVAFEGLAATCSHVFVAGLSMGGALALRLAERHGSRVAGLALVNPCLNVADPRLTIIRWLSVIPSFPGIGNDIARPGQDEAAYDRLPLRALHSQTQLWADVRTHLGQVDQPLLAYWSRQDHVVDPSSLALIQAEVRSTELEIVTLERSYHVATLDFDAEDIFRGSAEFFRAHLGERT